MEYDEAEVIAKCKETFHRAIECLGRAATPRWVSIAALREIDPGVDTLRLVRESARRELERLAAEALGVAAPEYEPKLESADDDLYWQAEELNRHADALEAWWGTEEGIRPSGTKAAIRPNNRLIFIT